MFLCYISLSNSWLVFIRQDPFSYVGPKIFLKISFSKTISLLFIVSFTIHVSHAYVTTGLITEKYNFSFAFLDKSLLWNISLFAKKTLFPRAILSCISSSIVLSVFTVDPRYLNYLSCSISLVSKLRLSLRIIKQLGIMLNKYVATRLTTYSVLIREKFVWEHL